MDRMLEATAAAEERHFWFRGLRRQARVLLDQALGARRSVRIVDCGTGTGRNLDWLADFGFAVGIERSAAGLRVGRAHRRRIVQASVTHLPLSDASVDLATSFDVLYCLDAESERRAVQEMWRVLRPDGVALVNAAALDVLRGSHSVLTGEVRRYTRRRLADLLQAAGFTIERLTYTTMTPFPAALVIRSLERLTGRGASASDADLRVPPRPVNALFDAALAVEARLLGWVNLPIGTSVMCVARKGGENRFSAALPLERA
jgi:SAM-dependent methyltransferase